MILEGARALLAAHKVDVLEFEYHSKGMWSDFRPPSDRRDLKAVLRWLHGAGYTCFWQGDSGALAQASGAAWCDAFEIRRHSNLVCSHLPTIVDALRACDCAVAPAPATALDLMEAQRRRHCDWVAEGLRATGGGVRKQHRAAYAD